MRQPSTLPRFLVMIEMLTGTELFGKTVTKDGPERTSKSEKV